MRYVLDTNAVSALMRGDPRVIDRLTGAGRSAVRIPQPVLAEIEYGIRRLPRSRRRDALRERFALVSSELARAAWTDTVSAAFGSIKASMERAGTRIEDFDAAIAAHALALAHDAILVTANVDEMARIPGVVVEDWSTAPAAR